MFERYDPKLKKSSLTKLYWNYIFNSSKIIMNMKQKSYKRKILNNICATWASVSAYNIIVDSFNG